MLSITKRLFSSAGTAYAAAAAATGAANAAAAATAADRSVTVTMFKVPDCQLCEEAKHIVEVVQKKAAKENVVLNIAEVDIHDPSTNGKYLKYMFDVPVLHLQDTMWGMHRVDPGKLWNDVQSAAEELAVREEPVVAPATPEAATVDAAAATSETAPAPAADAAPAPPAQQQQQ
ncbi:hypothetical protein H9P43_002625 [Blastocladiella emersonii ATCC 22665]|nr:hypothetical protein H9P43_002625 [Blastocladiella emersonii ATCC 22665]